MAGRKSRRDGMTLPEVVEHYERLAIRTDTGCLELHAVSCNAKGYPNAAWPGSKAIKRVGQMVLTHYRGPVPSGMEMCHSCHNRKCIAIEHLRWDTHWANVVECIRAGRGGSQKVTVEDVRGIRWLVRLGVPQVTIVELTGLSKAEVSRIVTGKRWAHVTG